MISTIEEKFKELFHSKPVLVKAPGRINLIGEHTDYNEGYVLPAAIDKSISFAMASNDKGVFRFYSLDFNELFETNDIDAESGSKKWAQYLLGVLAQFRKENVAITGVDCVFGGNIPIGAGVSSSAALECGFAIGLNKLFLSDFSNFKLVQMSQQAEHEYAGVMCGIMDQYTCVFGKKDHVFRLDCRTNEHQYFKFGLKDYIIALVDTKIKHELASSAYNQRRKDCEDGVLALKNWYPEIKALRDVSHSQIEKHKNELDPNLYKRCHYVISENQRVLDACDAIERNDYKRFGELLYKSHEGLQKNYEVSCYELDLLVDYTKQMDFVYGSRMMGGGFGGCTINIISKKEELTFLNEITQKYKYHTKIEPGIYFVNFSSGARIIN